MLKHSLFLFFWFILFVCSVLVANAFDKCWYSTSTKMKQHIYIKLLVKLRKNTIKCFKLLDGAYDKNVMLQI